MKISNNNFTIKNKLMAAIVLTLVLFSCSSIISHRLDLFTSELFAISLALKQSESGMLTLRRNEKDFLARSNIKYLSAFEQNLVTLLARLNTIGQSVTTQNINDNNQIKQLTAALHLYQKHFSQLVSIKQNIGLTSSEGLLGQLRESIHQVELLINTGNHSLLLSDMLQLRRFEKDFIARHRLTDAEKHQGQVNIFVKNVSRSNFSIKQQLALTNNIREYEINFNAVVDAITVLGLHYDEGVLGQMRKTVHETEQAFVLLDEMLSEQLDLANKNALWFKNLSTMFVAFCIISALFLVSRSILQRIESVNKHLLQIAQGEGDLTVRLDDSGKDEISQLAHSFNCFVDKLKIMFGKISTISVSLAGTTSQNAQATSGSLTSINEQLAISSMVNESIKEMITTSGSITANISEAADAAGQSKQSALDGTEISIESTKTMEKLDGSIAQAVIEIDQLKQSSNNIGSVLGVISGIADQTNLLALNAAIEAARAGENGRGFAVVADEVRSLAQRTQESTGEIQKLIELLQEGVTKSASSMELCRESAKQGLEQTQLMVTTLKIIEKNSDEIFNMNTQIAAASEQQLMTSNSIGQHIESIVNQANATATHTEKSVTMSEQVSGMSQQLNGLITQYRV